VAANFTLKVHVEIAASHILPGHPGACARLHGHNWKIEVEARATQLDDLGMGLDFQELKRETRAITDPLDHRHLNDSPPFDRISPTAENLAAHVYTSLKQRLDRPGIRVHAVTIFETDRCSVRYGED
jgi:6-pyruvoyltetrahydropterin/6-carboxytetrahydropterin synthase